MGLTFDFIVKNLSTTRSQIFSKLPANFEFTAMTTDSRKVTPGCLFVALVGEKFDGHDFLQQAIDAGAAGLICRDGSLLNPGLSSLAVFWVKDNAGTLNAYRELAYAWRKQFTLPVVAVAGSVGKTTTKELLSALLRGRWEKVLKTEGSQNGFVGIPMTLLELRPEHGAAVIEVGIDEVGSMIPHLDVVCPDASLLTAIAAEHLEKLIDLPTVAREEGFALSQVAERQGLVAISLDDPWIAPHWKSLGKICKVGYTLHSETAQKALEHAFGAPILTGKLMDANTLRVSGFPTGDETYTLPLPGKHNAANFLAALALATGLGLTPQELKKGLATFVGASGRSELRTLKSGTPVVCDYYNASPASMEAGLEMLADVARAKKSKSLWACLGDMLELGPLEEDFHRALAPSLQRLNIQNVLLFGPRMKALLDELKKQNFSGQVNHFNSHEELAAQLTRGIQPNDAILIKGSRGMRMEKVWEQIQ